MDLLRILFLLQKRVLQYIYRNLDLGEFYIDLYLQKKVDLVQNSVAVFAKFIFAKFGPKGRVFGVLSSDVGIA